VTEVQKNSSTRFLTEDAPQRLTFSPVAPGISRAVANNASLMTYHGTNTYLIETADGDFLLDPGPVEDEAHLELLCEAIAPRGVGILITHHHIDHSGLLGLLKKRSGLPVYASEHYAGDILIADKLLKDGDVVAGLEVVFTPGHASDHICFSRGDVMFSGDHVMAWNSSIVRGPDGNMKAYVNSLNRLLVRSEPLYLPGHGPALPDPHPYVERLLGNRVRRENDIFAMLQRVGETTIQEIARVLYNKSDPYLVWAAEANVEAHLHKLRDEGKVRQNGDNWRSV